MDALRDQYNRALKEEVKEEVMDCGFVVVDSEDVHHLCTACLCATRTTHTLDDVTLKQYYIKILTETQLEAGEPVLQSPRLCWECVAHLKRSVRFREQVQDSYRLLQPMLLMCDKEVLAEFLQTSVCRPGRLRTCFAHSINISQTMTAEQHDDADGVELLPVQVKEEREDEQLQETDAHQKMTAEQHDDDDDDGVEPLPVQVKEEREDEQLQETDAHQTMTAEQHDDDDDDGDRTDDNNRLAARPPPQSYSGEGRGRGRASEPAQGAGAGPGTSGAQTKRTSSGDQLSPLSRETSRGPHKRACRSAPNAIVKPVISHALARNWHLVMLVVPQDGRDLTDEQYRILFLELEKRYEEAVDDLTQDFVPGFDQTPRRLTQSGLKFICLDLATVSWLQEVALKLPPLWEGGCQFKAVSWTELPTLVKGVVWLPDAHGTDIEGLRDTLVRANRQRDIDMSRWRLLKGEFKHSKEGLLGAIMVFCIPVADIPKLARRQMKLCYKCGSVKVEVRRRKFASLE